VSSSIGISFLFPLPCTYLPSFADYLCFSSMILTIVVLDIAVVAGPSTLESLRLALESDFLGN